MDLGYAGLTRYSFLSAGFWVVMVAAFAFTLVFVVGLTRGRRAARLWVSLCVALAVLGGIAVMLWAVATGEWRSFMLNFGVGPLFEMAMLAFLLLGILWFLAIRYTGGLKD